MDKKRATTIFAAGYIDGEVWMLMKALATPILPIHNVLVIMLEMR
jgi:hypothetical protein